MKEANLKRLNIILFQLYDILEKAKTMEKVKRSVVVKDLLRGGVNRLGGAQGIFREVKGV